MQISLNKIKQYVTIPQSVSDDDLISLIGSRLVEIEQVTNLAPKYQGIYIAKVMKCEPIPETHLHLCEIDAGAHTAEFNQLDNGLVQVVCGAPNVHAGMLAAWIAPGSIVPSTYGNENFRLSVRKLRGYDSNGMLTAADELDLGADHDGIIEIDPKTAQPGDAFAAVFDLNDLILDVENKSLTHRPDCFGLIGFAREVAGILGVPFQEPAVFAALDQAKVAIQQAVPLDVEIADPKLCSRYTCAILDLPNNQPGKYFTKTAAFLAKSGMRAIDPIVDLTNVLMLETGQPLHAFDYDKLVAVGHTKTPKIIVRAAKPGEELQLLDGKTVTCTADDILITSNNVPIALAGAMGGKNTEDDASTKRIVLESATFSLYHLRKTQMAHGIFSEAITRFTKGQPAAITLPVLAAAIQQLDVTPLAVVDAYPGKAKPNVVKITTLAINRLLGTDYDLKTITRTLENVGFAVQASGDELTVTAPLWRTDIQIPEDVIEEVGRLLGYDNIPLALPLRPFTEPEIDPMLQLKAELRQTLSSGLAMHEVLTYTFVSRQLLEKVGQDPANSYEIVNSISPELQCFRQQIAPSLIDKLRENIKSGHKAFMLYEVNQVSSKAAGLNAEQVPLTTTHLGIAGLSDFYQLKAQILDAFQRVLKLNLSYAGFAPDSSTAKRYPYLEPLRSAELFYDDQSIGAFGELRSGVLTRFKLTAPITALELELDDIVAAPRQLQPRLQLSKFPAVERDLTLKVAADLPFGRVLNTLDDCLQGQDLYYTVTPVSIYQSDSAAPTKNLSFHLKFSDPTQTLNSDQISAIMENITIAAAELGASVV